METVHFFYGTARKHTRFPPGRVVVLRDDLTHGILHRDRLLSQRLRCGYLGEPLADVDRVLEAVRPLGIADEVVVWHGPRPAEQMLLAWLVPWLSGELTRCSVRLALATDPQSEPLPAEGATSQDLLRGYMSRRSVDAKVDALLVRLWEAVTAETPAALQAVSDKELWALPLWVNARTALLSRYPDATGLNFHDRVLLGQCSLRWRGAGRVLSGTVKNAATVAPLSDRAAWRRLQRLMGESGEESALVEVRCAGPFVPGECDVRLTPLGVDAVQGIVDVLEYLPLTDWIGGVLLQSPDRIWRWTDFGLVRDEQD